MNDSPTQRELELEELGSTLLLAALLKLNKPEVGTMVHDQATGRFHSVDARLVKAIKNFANLLGLSLGEETQEEALDRKARGATKARIEVTPHDPDGPKSKEDVRCREQPWGSGTSG